MINGNLIIEKFYNYLINKGFPEESIIMDYSIDGKEKIDFTIISGYAKTPVMFFDLRITKNIEVIKRHVLKQFSNLPVYYSQNVQNFIVIFNDKNDSFDIYDITRALNKEKTIEECLDKKNRIDLLNYKILENGLKKNVKSKIKSTREKKIKDLKIFSWIVTPIIFITIILLEIFTPLKLTTNDLFLLGGTVIVILLPFFKEIKISDVSLKLEEQFENDSRK